MQINGYRMEPREIEAVLRNHPAVGQAHVMLRATGPNGEEQLVAYCIPAAGRDLPPTRELRAHAEQDLPGYMVPTAFVPLGRLPLTTSGEVDVSVLPAPDSAGGKGGAATPIDRPATPTEQTIAEVWSEVLELPAVRAQDDFFELGGHSLLMYMVHNRLAELLDREVPIVDLFRYRTVRDLARYLDDGVNGAGHGAGPNP